MIGRTLEHGKAGRALQSLQLPQRGAAGHGAMGRSSKLSGQWAEAELNSCSFFYWMSSVLEMWR